MLLKPDTFIDVLAIYEIKIKGMVYPKIKSHSGENGQVIKRWTKIIKL